MKTDELSAVKDNLNIDPTFKVGLIGNPNSGKTTLFNAITGSRQFIGNWPGVTIEQKIGQRKHLGKTLSITDLPGIYSLSTYSPEEMVARDFLISRETDLFINVIDTSNLDRNLYLSLQIIEMGLPIIIALNMMDVIADQGKAIDIALLEKRLGVPIIPVIASEKKGITELLDSILTMLNKKNGLDKRENSRHKSYIRIDYGPEIEEKLDYLSEFISSNDESGSLPYRYMGLELLAMKDTLEKGDTSSLNESIPLRKDLLEKIEAIIVTYNGSLPENISKVIAEKKYDEIKKIIDGLITTKKEHKKSPTLVLDKVLTHKILGYPIFFAIIWGMFQLTYTVGSVPSDWMDTGLSFLQEYLVGIIPSSFFSEAVFGMLEGFKVIVIFLPQIFILFFLTSLLENTGYMSRIVFMIDRLMRAIGLQGKSFVPMILGFGCNIPAIMATRSIKGNRHRILTIMIIPFMSCTARYPVYILLSNIFFPNSVVFMLMVMYLIGVVTAIFSVAIFNLFLREKKNIPFIEEMPSYRLPKLAQSLGQTSRNIWIYTKDLLLHAWMKVRFFLKEASLYILFGSLFVIIITNYPKPENYSVDYDQEIGRLEQEIEGIRNGTAPDYTDSITSEERIAHLERQILILNENKSKEELAYSIGGQFGKLIEPIIKPLGMNWRLGISLIPGFLAKEMVVSTLGVLYADPNVSTEDGALESNLEKDMSPLAAVAFMLFTLLYIPCLSTLALIIREVRKPAYILLAIGYPLFIAYSLAFLAYNVPQWLGWL